jgi:hypothetical protein
MTAKQRELHMEDARDHAENGAPAQWVATLKQPVRTNAIAALFVMALSGCAAPYGEKAMALTVGATRDQVLTTLGQPDNRQLNGAKEALQYSNVVGPGFCEYTVILLDSGKLYGIDSYRNISHTGCRSGTKSVTWETPPDQTIEIRRR